jgi:hypothetical protein
MNSKINPIISKIVMILITAFIKFYGKFYFIKHTKMNIFMLKKVMCDSKCSLERITWKFTKVINMAIKVPKV